MVTGYCNSIGAISLKYVLASCLLLLAGMEIRAQQDTVKVPEVADYALWHQLRLHGVSPKGHWLSYGIYYEEDTDTLVVREAYGSRSYCFPGGHSGSFAGDHYYAAKNPLGGVSLLNLESGHKEEIPNASKYVLSEEKPFLMVLHQEKGTSQFTIKHLDTGRETVIHDAANFWYSGKAEAVAVAKTISGETELFIIRLGQKVQCEKIAEGTGDITALEWQDNGSSLAYIMDAGTKGQHVALFRLNESQPMYFDPRDYGNFDRDAKIVSTSFASLKIARDGRQVFFGLQQPQPADPGPGVQVWNTGDKFIYPSKAMVGNWEKLEKVGLWWPDTDTYSPVTDTLKPKLMLNGDQSHALLFNPMANEPSNDREAPLDIFIRDLRSGDTRLLLKSQPASGDRLSVSPLGRYVVYFRDGNWHVYDIYGRHSRNLTAAINAEFAQSDHNWPEEAPAFGHPGWMDGDEALLLYDRYDIWKVAADGSYTRRLTKGSETGTRFRIVSDPPNDEGAGNYDGSKKGSYLSSQKILLSRQKAFQHGYSVLNDRKVMAATDMREAYRSQPLLSDDGSCVVFIEEGFNTPPRIVASGKGSRNNVVYASNPQHSRFRCGDRKIISYQDASGSPLNGILYYPVGYTPEKKYPMVVHVYEMQSGGAHRYINPTLYNPVGFNITHLTANGYFVLLPDIRQRIGETGNAALFCTVAALDAAIACASVDAARVGLIGQSFGGYETLFIATHSNRFAAAVCGAGISDYISGYLDVAWGLGRPRFYHYEYGQMRMGKSLFDDPGRYRDNSPLYSAGNLNTPLLLWAGTADTQVNYDQSIKFYLAMRRLGKEGTMLLYPDEGHVLYGSANQRHLTQSIGQWFDHHLKGKEMPEWSRD